MTNDRRPPAPSLLLSAHSRASITLRRHSCRWGPSMGAESSSRCIFEPEKLVLKLRVTLAADRSAIDAVVRSIMEVVRKTGCATGKEDCIELALSEAIANAVIHGAKADPSKV